MTPGASPTPETRSRDDDRGFLGQPRALANLFGVELWERFSFYGMQGILLIYLYYSATDGGLGMDQGTATGIVGAYGGSVYLSTILGAWLADRVVGPERTLFGSAVVVMVGHIALAVVPGFAGVAVGCVLIALGSGGVKATATSIVGSLYAIGDERRDAGFSLFYMGINIGALVGPLLTGVLQKEAGFHWGFGLAAVGMAAGLAQYAAGRRRLPAESRVVPNPLPRSLAVRYAGAAVAVLVVVVLLAVTGLLTIDNLADWVVGITLAAALAYFVVILTSSHVDATERSRVWSFVPLFVVNAVFWSLYQQQFTVVTIYSDERLNRDLFGWEMPVSWVQSINPVFIIALAGAFAALWTKLGPRQPSTPVKFGLGTITMGVAFLLFLLTPEGVNSVPLLALVGILLVFTIAELLISPVGLSLSTKLAPRQFRTQMVALYFLSVSLGTTMAGRLGEFYDPDDEGGYFLIIGLVAIAVGALLLLATKPIQRLMAGVH
ncbi:peptide MFS transporter [Nocardioides marmotae]|uniref:MFS transporter n=1 Tax=Nocardioides marmotae TaxID=2663857 RepID=A0A6I3JA04_9ACTN|nr:peptide MFS transporter [Nocardioides marmotae]MCR6031481.1 MFS transporter [Gordonia jinghuaiqii]MBC9733363.1 peptide MFS transporter [Nocardioides marmotae]MTB84470.1 MFS transporter [Nocardioides marmotae]MTB95120.1 MFS transporter [Nocardioides marmotae]QKE02392.1 peptide MFS transporter [Nocardioides marmotae]